MKIVTCLFVLSLCLAGLLPVVNAQTSPPPPPPCCPRAPEPGETGTGGLSGNVTAQLIVPQEMVRLYGGSRSQFVDRVTEAVFPGKSVQLIVRWHRREDLLASDGGRSRAESAGAGGAGFGLIAIEETYVYRFPRSRLTPEQIDKLDELVLTDGEFSMKMSFVSGGAATTAER